MTEEKFESNFKIIEAVVNDTIDSFLKVSELMADEEQSKYELSTRILFALIFCFLTDHGHLNNIQAEKNFDSFILKIKSIKNVYLTS